MSYHIIQFKKRHMDGSNYLKNKNLGAIATAKVLKNIIILSFAKEFFFEKF